MLKPQNGKLSPEEYFRMEEQSEDRHEYFDGEIFAMTGGSHNHNVINVNMVSALDGLLEGSDCQVYSNDMKVRAEEDKRFFYPDATVVCGKIEFEKGRDDMILNPVVVFEVLSKTTMDYDRGTKFVAYRQIPSLREYVLVDQYSHRVEHYKREDGGQWRLEDLTDIGKVLHLSSIDVKLPLERIYRRLDLEKLGKPSR